MHLVGWKQHKKNRGKNLEGEINLCVAFKSFTSRAGEHGICRARRHTGQNERERLIYVWVRAGEEEGAME